VPVAIFLLAIILTLYFYHLLPAEVAYHFEDGAPDRWLNRVAILAWLVIPQFVLVLFALGITAVATILSVRFQIAENTLIKKLLSIMGNMVALPQIILAFAMLDIFLYNAYQIHLVPLWVFALLVMVLGGIVLGISLIQSIRQFRGTPGKSL